MDRWFVPDITKLCLNFSKLYLEYRGLFFPDTVYTCRPYILQLQISYNVRLPNYKSWLSVDEVI